HAFHTVTAERALTRAEAIDRDRERWRDAPLAGVPVALKDNVLTRGVTTTAGSLILETYVPPYDATVVAKLEQAGAIVVGKRIATSSQWARRPRTRPSYRRSIRGPKIARQADRAVDRPPPWLHGWRRSPSAPTPADPSASRRRCAASSG